MTRGATLLLILVLLEVLGVLATAHWMLQRDRVSLVEDFSAERLTVLDRAVADFDDDWKDIGEDLEFVSRLMTAAASHADRERELLALLAVVRQYLMAQVVDGNGRITLTVTDPATAALMEGVDLQPVILDSAKRAAESPVGRVVTSAALPGERGAWLRVFATRLPQESLETGPGSLALVVNTQPYFRRLELITMESNTRLLVLGPYGRPAPVSDPVLMSSALRAPPGGLEALLHELRAGRRGTMRISEADMAAMGLGTADAVAAYLPLPLSHAQPWAVATVTSVSALRAHETAIMLRVGGAALLIVVSLGALAWYLLVVSRRTVALRERLRHVAQLEHLHEKAEKILENIPTGVLSLSEQGRVTAINRALQGRLPDDAVGRTLRDALPQANPTVLERLDALTRSAQETGGACSLMGEQVTLFGHEGRYNLHAVPLEPRLPDARMLVVIEDLSEVRSLETQLLRSEKLATVGVLAAGIAHEIGTPLSVVRGRAEYMRGKVREEANVDGLNVIIEQIDHVTRTIRQLLDFSRARPAAVRELATRPTVEAVVELVRLEAQRRRITLSSEIQPDLPPLAADPDQLQQVLVNLMMNAMDACAEGGAVTVGATLKPPHGAAPWGMICLMVSDDGCGIPREIRNQIFDPFFTTKKRGQGTGLGLTMAAQIIRNHGGSIEVESGDGQGTRVVVMWPAAASRESQHV
ncbi:MAG: ATP-binding protein [Myxococcota bacterium]